MTVEGAALLRAICADPADDGLRLVYADLLEDAGDEARAEFIRVQVAIEKRRLGPAGQVSDDSPWLASDAKYQALRRRERELLEANEYLWLPADSPLVTEMMQANSTWIPAFEWTWRRGFVAHVTTTFALWLAHGPAIVAAQPVEQVTLTDREPQPNAVVGSQHRCAWTCDNRDQDLPSWLPWGLLDLLRPEGWDGQTWIVFDDAAAAQQALARACVAWARAAAGLPALGEAKEARR